MPKNQDSLLAFGLILVFYIFTFCQFGMWEKGGKGGDPLGYYSYLPAAFIYGDLTDLKSTNIARGNHLPRPFKENFYEEQQLVTKAPNGSKVIKYTCGLALIMLPFFTIAHYLAPFFGYSADGFSEIYTFSQYCAGFFYSIFGLWLLRLILLRWFKDKLVALSLILIALGTNLFFFTTYHSSMAHGTLFFLHTLIIYQTIKLYESQRWQNTLGLGVALGLTILIRPVEIVVVFIPIFWGMQILKKPELKERWRFFVTHRHKIALVIFSAFLVTIPQILYWFKLTGQFFYYSYGNEGFNFAKPQLIRGLFSYHNGWLAYTPIMYFAVIGLFYLKKNKISRIPILLFLIPHIYVTYSWWCWYYINGYGARPMVETYAILSLPFTAYWVKALGNKWLFSISLLLASFFVYLNLFQSWQFYKGLYRTEISNKEFYLSTMFKSELDFEDLILFDCGEWQPDTNRLALKSSLLFNGFEKDSTFSNITSEKRKLGLHSWKMGQPKRWELLKRPIKNLTIDKGDYIRLKFSAWKNVGGARMYASSIAAIRFESAKGKGLKTKRIRIDNKIANPTNSFWGNWKGQTWGDISFYSHVPKLPEDAVLTLYLDYGSPMEIYIDNVSVQIWEPIKEKLD